MKEDQKRIAMQPIALDRVNSFILQKQHLREGFAGENLLHVTADIVGLHATDPLSPYLSLFARMKHFHRNSLDDVLTKQRQLGKVRFVRNTIFILPQAMLPVAFAGLRQSLEKRIVDYLDHRGFSCQDYEKYSAQIFEVLSGAGKSTKEINKEFDVQANLSAVINIMCDQGLLIRGLPRTGWRSNQHVYHRMQDYFPDMDVTVISDADAKKSIVKRYLEVYGPVTEKDISWWTRFPKGEINQILEGLQKYISRVEIGNIGKSFLIMSADISRIDSIKMSDKDQVNVLPLLDPYIMGYKDREKMLNPQFYDYVFDRSGNATSTIVVNGQVIGVWDSIKDTPLEVRWLLFQPVSQGLRRSIESKVRAMGAFIAEEPVHLHRCHSMVPLSQRTAGSFMSPLKICESQNKRKP